MIRNKLKIRTTIVLKIYHKIKVIFKSMILSKVQYQIFKVNINNLVDRKPIINCLIFLKLLLKKIRLTKQVFLRIHTKKN